MRYVPLLIATVLSGIAVVASIMAWPKWVGAASIIGAGVMLVLWLTIQYQRTGGPDLTLDAEQRETVRRMKREGNMETAIKQVQLWKRGATRADATRIVREL